MKTINDLIVESTKELNDLGFETPRLDVDLILSHCLGVGRDQLLMRNKESLDPETYRKFLTQFEKRKQNVPIAYIVGYKEFYGLQFQVTKDVLIPRPETEYVVEAVSQRYDKKAQLKGADFGSGSGCIGVALMSLFPNLDVTFIDVSQQALQVCKKNVNSHFIERSSEFFELDLNSQDSRLSPDLKFDFIVANPPYISEEDEEVEEAVKKYEPKIALFAKENGLQSIKLWSEVASKHLVKNGYYIFEFGFGQANDIESYFSNTSALTLVEVIKDFASIDRVAVCQKES